MSPITAVAQSRPVTSPAPPAPPPNPIAPLLPPPAIPPLSNQTPVLLVDAHLVAQRYLELATALAGVHLHYAVKANPAPEVLKTLAAMGCRWDVASPGEIAAVLAVGADPAHLSYGNTIKKTADIAHAAQCGVRRFTVDSPDELAKITQVAPGSTVLVRLTTSGDGADWALGHKFGAAQGEARSLLETACRAGHPVGLAFHVGSQQRNPQAWDAPLAEVAQLRGNLQARGCDLDVVDLGGGFPASMLGSVPPLAEYGAAIADSIDRHLGRDLPELMAEPGRSLVADAGVLETEVVLVSQRAGVRWVYLDVGLFNGLVEAIGESVRYRLDVVRDGTAVTGPVGETILAGPTCDSLDILYQRHRYRLPLDLRPGDRLRFLSAGAYTTSYSSVGFNGFPPLRAEYR
jgi:ornithine decarboxylase